MKRIWIMLLAVIMICTSTLFCAYATRSTTENDAAQTLYYLGLFRGTGTDDIGTPTFGLTRTPTRSEAVIMLVRLLGKENEAIATNDNELPFDDVEDWAKKYVCYAYTHNLTKGVSETEFKGSSEVKADQYLTFVLRALGYDSSNDFQWDRAKEKTDELGITNVDDDFSDGFTRGNSAVISLNALNAKLKNSDKTLLDILTDENAVPKNANDILKPHEWNSGITTQEATCTEFGITTYTCNICGVEKKEKISALGHNPDSLSACSRCGETVKPELLMTPEGTKTALSVEYLSNFLFSTDKPNEKFVLSFGLKDQFNSYIKPPAFVDIKIKNDNGETVYNQTKAVQTNDYAYVTTRYSNYTGAKIEIPFSDILKSSEKTGTAYIKVYHPSGYFSFNEKEARIYGDLPEVNYADSCSIDMPITPWFLGNEDYRGNLESSVKITNIRCKIESSYDKKVKATIYFSGEKTYDSEGSGYSRPCVIGWKLYDEDGYVVESGTHYTSNMAVGEKFKDSEEYIYRLSPGKYRLEILDTK